MKKKTKRLFSLLLVLTLLFSMISLNSGFSAYAEETEGPAAEATEETEPPAATEESAPETAGPADTEPEPTDALEKPVEEETEPPEETEPSEETEPPKEDDPYEGKATGTIVELEEIQPSDEILAASYGLQIPVILYGTSTFSVSFKYPSDPKHTTYTVNLSGFRYHYLNGKMAYCLEPQAGSTAGAIYSQIAGGADLNVWERFLSDNQRNATSLVLAYGAPNTLTSSTKLTLHGYEAATQVLIWEIIIGYRSATKPYTRSNAGLYNFVLNLCNPNDSTGTLRAAYISGYDSILSAMANHEKIPSFTSKKLSQAPTHEMTYDAATGLYKVVLTDSNNAINNDFPFTNGNGLTFTKSGNKLTVTATAAALRNGPVTVSTKGKILDTENASPVIWGTTNSNHNVGQILSQLAKPDPVPCYFKLAADTTTDLTIQKVCADGNISRITFTVKDSGGSTLFTGQTDASGKLNVPGLEIGATVTITETVPENYVCENRTQTVTLAAGSNTVTFRNIPLGTATMSKVSDSGDVEGYGFRLYRHKSEGNSSRTWCGKSDADGRIYETDGDFNVLGSEKSFVFKGLTDGKYSFREVLSVYGAGNVWPESITFTTSGGTTAACNLTFTGEQLVAQENGDCTVSGISLTGLDGGGVLTVTVKNEPVILPEGEITVRKVDERGQALSGVTFLLEYSTDGDASWEAITSRNENDPVALGGCTSAGLTGGKLTTGSDGLAVFSGLCVETDEGSVLYRLTETATRPGYSLLSAPAYEGALPEEEEYVVSFTVVNMLEYQLPMTGGVGFKAAPIVATLLFSASMLLVVTFLRKRREGIE